MPDLSSIINNLEQQRTAIENALAALRGIGGETTTKRRGRRLGTKKVDGSGMTVAGRKRQAEAMRRYWAQRKAGGKRATKKAAKKGVLTDAGRKILSENMKRMWAEKKLGKDRS